MDLKKYFAENRILIMDGGSGTELLKAGYEPHNAPYDAVVSLHRAYLGAGSALILSNTFSPNCNNSKLYADIAVSATQNFGTGRFAAMDIGPRADYEAYFDDAKAGVDAGVDIIFLETMLTIEGTRAAIRAARRAAGEKKLPIFVSATFTESGYLHGATGVTAAQFAEMAECEGADAVGANCSFGPLLMRTSRIVEEMKNAVKIPIICKPNAGSGNAYTPQLFADEMIGLIEQGASIIGGCCGTTPHHIMILREKLEKGRYL